MTASLQYTSIPVKCLIGDTELVLKAPEIPVLPAPTMHYYLRYWACALPRVAMLSLVKYQLHAYQDPLFHYSLNPDFRRHYSTPTAITLTSFAGALRCHIAAA